MFKGLSAFPLTPVSETEILQKPLLRLIRTLADAQVGNAKLDSIGVLGSTGCYAYLQRDERAKVVELAVQNAAGIPVMVGIGALRTREVLALAEDAQKLGASAVMLAPVSYQKLTEDEVFNLYRQLSSTLSVPLCVYDNPGTTHFNFSDALYARIAALPHVASIKIPPLNLDDISAQQRIATLKQILPSHLSIGISGDWCGLSGLMAGCDIWYSAIAGVLPLPILRITQALSRGDRELALKLQQELTPLMSMIQQFGSLRVAAGVAQIKGITDATYLPLPVQGLSEANLMRLAAVLEALE